MPSSKEYLLFVLDQLSYLSDITYRLMMGEYVLYYKGKIFGGIYDDRFLVKVTTASLEIIKDPIFEVPYDGAKELILLEEIDNKEFIKELIERMYDELPLVKKRLPNSI